MKCCLFRNNGSTVAFTRIVFWRFESGRVSRSRCDFELFRETGALGSQEALHFGRRCRFRDDANTDK